MLSQDIIFVGGGSTKFLVNTLKKYGADKNLKQAWEKGVVLAGVSAGAMCMFTKNFTNPRHDVFEPLDCLGLLKGSFCPHYVSAKRLKEIFSRMIMKKEIPSGYGVEDGVALHFLGKKLHYVVSSRPGAGAYFVKENFRTVNIKSLPVEYLKTSSIYSVSPK
jgi:peptidase E